VCLTSAADSCPRVMVRRMFRRMEPVDDIFNWEKDYNLY